MSSEVVSIDNHPEVVTHNALAVTSGLQHHQLDSIISDSLLRNFQLAFVIILLGVISAAGMVANVINIIVFIRQGVLSSSSNVSLLALACADIVCLLTIFCASVTYAVMRVDSDTLFLSPSDFMYVSVTCQHLLALDITSYITVYISFERCMCVVLPLKVKTLFSAKRSLYILITIVVVFILLYIPVFSTLGLAEVTDPVTNRTKMIFSPTKDFEKVMEISDYVDAIFIRTLSLLMVFVCTQITVYYVRLSKSWRKSILTHAETATSGKSKTKISFKISNAKDQEKRDEEKSSNDNDNEPATVTRPTTKTTTHSHSNKERRLVRMITLISTIFLMCTTPDIIIVFLFHSVPFFKKLSIMDNFYGILFPSQYLMESINSSINIIVYYRMSSRYKQEFRVLFGLDSKKLT